MKRLSRLSMLAAIVLAATTTGCGQDSSSVMPDVMGQRLDIALSDVERAGIDDEPEVVGGGTFGVVDESNWVVCEQDPAPGGTVAGTPRMVVDRECDAPSGDSADGSVDEPADEDAVAASDGEASEGATHEKPRKPKAPQAAVSDFFTMPSLVGLNLQLAQDTLQSQGSFLLTQTDGLGLSRFQMDDSNWRVCGQRPEAGTKTDIATLVELIAVKLDESC